MILGALAPAGPAATAADGDVVLEAALADDRVKLGEDVVVRVTLTNRSSKPVVVPALRLARDSLSLRLEFATGGGTLITRSYGSFFHEEGQVKFRPTPTGRRRLEPGGTLDVTLSFPAVHLGKFTVSPLLGAAGADRVEGKPAPLEVVPPNPATRRLEIEVQTTRGNFRIELDGAAAFNSVSHFWALVRDGFFNDLPVHRVVPEMLVQTGDPRGDRTGGPGWYLPAEYPSQTFPRGAVGLARGVHEDSAGSQWFVAVAKGDDAADAFRGGFTPLGKVVEGLEVVDALSQVKLVPDTDRPESPDRVLTVRPAGR